MTDNSKVSKMVSKIGLICAVLTFTMLFANLVIWPFNTWHLRVTFFTLVVIQLGLSQFGQREKKFSAKLVSLIIIIFAIAVCGYAYFAGFDYLVRATFFPNNMDIVIGTILFIITMYFTLVTTGYILPVIALCLFAYTLLGKYFPAFLKFSGIGFGRIVTNFNSPQGIYGQVFGVVPTYVFVFVLLGTIMNISKAGDFFIKFANSIAGHARGGPAKVAVLSSSAIGTITGSTVSNVVITGSFTIPMMIKHGITRVRAAAVEATASTGGQIMPPVMGAAAFVMADILGISYNVIVICGIVPAVLYFLSIMINVHYISPVNTEKNESFGLILRNSWQVLKKQGYLGLPLILLVVLLYGTSMSPLRAGLWSILLAFCLSWVSRLNRIDFGKLGELVVDTVHNLTNITGISAIAGIVIALLDLSGLGIKFTYLIVSLGGSSLPAILIIVAIVTVFLGMGLPTVGAYILAATITTPPMIALGINPIVSHFFVFYFACLSSITPPICIGSFAASAIAKADPYQTGWEGVRIAFMSWLIPFTFVLRPQILFYEGGWATCLFSVFIVLILTVGLNLAYREKFVGVLGNFIRVLILAASLFLAVPSRTYLEIIAILVVVVGLIVNYLIKIGVGVPSTQTLPAKE